MIRALLGAAFPIVGLSLVAAFTGPDLITGTGGAPMIVSGGDRVELANARFDGDTCALTLLYGDTPDGNADGIRVVAMTLRADGEVEELGIRELPGAGVRETVLLLFDEDGELVSASEPAALQPAAAAHGDCVKAPKPSGQKPA